MPTKALIAAMDIYKNSNKLYSKGDVISLVTEGGDFGNKEVLPTFIQLTVPDLDREQAHQYLEMWQIDFLYTLLNQNSQEWRYKLEVDPAYISVSDVGKNEIKSNMQDAIDNAESHEVFYESSVQTFSSSSITVNIPKDGSYQTSRALTDNEFRLRWLDRFSDIFKTSINLRRYYFDPVQIDDVVNNHDGKRTLTKAQVQANILDKLDE